MFANTHQREFATNFYGLKADPKVIDVDPNSPADIAGLEGRRRNPEFRDRQCPDQRILFAERIGGGNSKRL